MSEDILRKVRGLLAKAEDPACTPAEAETYSRHAEKLLQKYAIDRALLAEEPGKTKEDVVIRRIDVEAQYSKPKMFILGGIAQSFGVRVVRRRDQGEPFLQCYGYAPDLDMVETLYTSLLLQGNNAVLLDRNTSRSYRTSFWYGFANRVYQRLDDERTRLRQEVVTSGKGLVLASRESRVEARYEQDFPQVRTIAPGRVTSHAGASAGAAAADRADLGHKRFDGVGGVLSV